LAVALFCLNSGNFATFSMVQFRWTRLCSVIVSW